ncbi:MAG: hypothetical protein H6Q05_3793 [Acidobacteria bacterium]|jgi:hypothetical protein|nr:hypothetical protein [Acidobacteriota bacterium]
MSGKASMLFCTLLLAVAIPAAAQTQDQGKEPPKEPAKAVNISGVWELTVQTQQGDMTNDATFAQEKEVLKVTMTGPQGMALPGEGTVKEGIVQWLVTISTSQGDFVMTFRGKVDGETMAGEIQMGDFGTTSWSAKKKK